MSLLHKTYKAVTCLSAPLFKRLLKARLRSGKEDKDRIGERMGTPSRPRPPGKLVWIHAASVGEAQSALILIDRLQTLETGIHILVTTGTVTSAALMTQRLPANATHQYMPLDHPAWTSTFLDHWRPDLVLWLESELWPNMLAKLKHRNVPVILVNARMSQRSLRNWMHMRGFAGSVLSTYSLILAQTEKDRENFAALGAQNVFTSGNIKYSAAPLPFDALAFSGIDLTIGERPCWVYASTHEGEEALACRIHERLRATVKNVLTIIVPRHPERRDAIAKICRASGLSFRLRGPDMLLPMVENDIYIADTMGELGLFYTLCPVAMIGRSFSDDGGGGHNPVEAAQFGCAVVTGPNNQYQEQLYSDMDAAGAVIRTETEDALVETLMSLFQNPEKLEAYQEKSRAFVSGKNDVVDGVMAKIMPYLNSIAPVPHAP